MFQAFYDIGSILKVPGLNYPKKYIQVDVLVYA